MYALEPSAPTPGKTRPSIQPRKNPGSHLSVMHKDISFMICKGILKSIHCAFLGKFTIQPVLIRFSFLMLCKSLWKKITECEYPPPLPHHIVFQVYITNVIETCNQHTFIRSFFNIKGIPVNDSLTMLTWPSPFPPTSSRHTFPPLQQNGISVFYTHAHAHFEHVYRQRCVSEDGNYNPHGICVITCLMKTRKWD